MTQTTNRLGELSTEQRDRLEAWLMEFDGAWRRGLFQEYAASIPAELASFSSVCLLELAKVDLDRRWSDGEQFLVENYLREIPSLGTVESVSADLLLAEYIARKSAGEENVSQGLCHRFPHRATELKRLIQQGRPGESISRRVSQARETQSGKSDTQSVAQEAVARPVRRTKTEPTAGQKSAGIPARFGRYNILRQLGQGAMGAVYLAEDTQLHRQVALKTPSFKGSDSDGLIDRFHREAHAAANLRHANICPVYDVGEIDGRHFITMAYIDGRELSSFIKPEEPTAERTAAMLIRKLALALQYAHEIGTVHRDLKPSNIMIDRRREPIIMDFGLARKLDTSDQSRATQLGTLLGTPAYMSPEQVDGDLDAGEQSDIYSLGVILFELLTGRLPFEGTITAIIGQKLVNDAPKPSEFRGDLDPTLEAICLKMMAKSREQRYASMAEAAAALTDYLKQPRPKVTASVQQANDEAGLQALFEAVGEEQNSIAPPDRHPSPLLSDRWKGLPPAAKWSALGGMAALVVLSVVLLFRRPDGGTLRIEVDDPNLIVLLDGDELTLTDKTWEGKKKDQKHKLSVKVGDHRLTIGSPTKITLNDGRTVTHKLTLTLNGAELSSDSFEIVRGETTVVKISLETSTPRQNADSKVPSGNKGNPWPANAPPIAVAPFDETTAKKHQQAWADFLGVPVEREIVIGKNKDGNDVKMTMVFIPPGEFMMGSSKKVQDHWLNDAIAAKSRWSIQHISSEGPQHRVRITKPFYLGKYEVTQAQWQELMTKNPSRFNDQPTHPVERVNWQEIQAFLTKVRAQGSTVEGLSFVLPTEAQWEYACRAGTTTNWYEGDSEKDLQRCGWFAANANGTTHPVGGLKPNAFGLYDMHGNVFEVCQDWFSGGDYYSKSPVDDPSGPPPGRNRVARGGAFDHHARACRSAYRNHHPLHLRFVHLGLRLAMAIDIEKTLRKKVAPSRKLPQADAAGWIDLISQIDIKRDARSGQSTKQGNNLQVFGGPRSNPLQLPFQPDGSYEIEASFTRHQLSLDHGISITLLGANFVNAVFCGWAQERMSGLYGPSFADSNPTRTAAFQIEKEKQHTVGVRVIIEGKQVRITGTAEGKPLFDWKGDASQLSVPLIYRRYGQNSVLDCWGPGRTTFHSLRWRALPDAKIGEISAPSQTGIDGWISLFNGKTLDGWKSTDTHPKAWSVQNQSIVVEGAGRGYLVRDFPAKDFEVSLEYRTLKPSNRGVIARAPDKQLGPKKAIEFTLIDRASFSQTQLQQDGGINLPPESPDLLAPLKRQPGEWNHVRLSMQGASGELWFNGKLVVKKDLSRLARFVPHHTAVTRQAVRVVLQHWGRERVEFRNIRVRELPPAKATLAPTKAKRPRGKGFGGGRGFGGGGRKRVGGRR